MSELERFADEVWTVSRPQRFFGTRVGTRMTAVRLPGPVLFVHSPVALDPVLQRDLEALAPVRYVVAPNLYHHLYVGDFARAFPEARLFACPGLGRKRRDLGFEAELGDAPGPWHPELLHHRVEGVVQVPELVFFHPASRTLLVSDLLFHLERPEGAWTRLYASLDGVREPSPGRLIRLLTRDRARARASLEAILDWDFERIVLAHGTPIASDGRRVLREAWSWLLEGAA